MNCPNCNTAVKDGMRFCPKCGTKIESISFGSAPTPTYGVTGGSSLVSNKRMQEVKCPSCGSPNVEQIDTDKYQCPYCGHTFVVHKEVQVTPPQPQMSQPQFQQPQFQQPQFQQPQFQQPQFQHPQHDYLADFDDEPGCLMNGICFCWPIVGIILYFVKKDTLPNCAQSYLSWALIGIAVGFFCGVFSVFL